MVFSPSICHAKHQPGSSHRPKTIKVAVSLPRKVVVQWVMVAWVGWWVDSGGWFNLNA
jgi:hypothetical protein